MRAFFWRVSRWITAESTFGFGLKCFAGTRNAKVGSAYNWIWSARIDSGGSVTIFSATSFWIRRVVETGGFSVVRKWVMSGEVM